MLHISPWFLILAAIERGMRQVRKKWYILDQIKVKQSWLFHKRFILLDIEVVCITKIKIYDVLLKRNVSALILWHKFKPLKLYRELNNFASKNASNPVNFLLSIFYNLKQKKQPKQTYFQCICLLFLMAIPLILSEFVFSIFFRKFWKISQLEMKKPSHISPFIHFPYHNLAQLASV